MLDVHLGFIGKCVVDFLLVIIEQFSLDVTSKVLRAKTISIQRAQFDPKFQVEGDVPTNNFCMDSQANECPTTLPLTVFTHRNFVADFREVRF